MRPPPHQLPFSARCLAIVPAFNEGASVGELVHRLHRALPGFDVLVIDDGSTDSTRHQVPDGAAIVSLPFNLGIGGAMQTGYRYAALNGYDIAVQVDGDGQHRPSEVLRLVEHLLRGDADLVVGSRFLDPTPRYRQTVVRKTGAWFLRALIRWLTGLEITDCTSGFRAANKRVINAFAHWYPEDYPEPEIILLLHRAGFKVSELSVRMRQRRSGASSIGLLKGVFYVIKVTACLLLDTVREPWPEGKVQPRDASPDVDLLIIGISLCLLAVRRLRRYKLKERYALLFLVMGLPFVLLAIFPHAIYFIAKFLDIEPATVMVLCMAIFLILMVFELLTIVSQQDRKITTLAQMVGILTERLEREQTRESTEATAAAERRDSTPSSTP